ncbi:hypothetical protein CTI12_AA218680 [Artemisia annua]|uniref:COI1 F-box domain-containing protein n=1 Tax=Artemisia annua TaxID=35608 RepID=A0A2U1NWY4_ARTAN|nr:hypothetical protein CTI12_AA218680 [Artemisia annua]
METVLDCVIPYIHDGNDLNSISLVSRKFYELDCITRKHVTVHLHYAPSPFLLNQRFPFLESLTLKGFPDDFEYGHRTADVTPWIREIAVSFKCLKALHIRRLFICDSNIELLAKTRGNDLRSLKIYKCTEISENGVMYISIYCDKLTTLCLSLFSFDYDSAKWLHELALRNTGIETFSLEMYERHGSYYEDIAPLLKSCGKSLVSLRIKGDYGDDTRDTFSYAVNLKHLFLPINFEFNVDYGSFKFPPTIRCLGIDELSETSAPFVLPLFNQLRELELECLRFDDPFQCSFLQRCPNLEVLCAKHVRDPLHKGLQLVSQFLKKLRKLTFNSGTPTGLIAVAQGCPNMENLHVKLTDISNEALECIGSNLRNLSDFDMEVGEIRNNTTRDLLLDNGTRAMLVGCTKLEKLGIHLYATAYLSDVGLGFIGKYGVNLRFLSLTRIGESDGGLLELSKGCPKLRKLRMIYCPFSKQAVTGFVFNIHSLRYSWGIIHGRTYTEFFATRPNFKVSTIAAQVLTKPKPYLTLAETLGKLASQLLAGGSGMKSAKVTHAIGGAPNDLDARLLRTMVAKGIRISEERVILHGSSKKPLDIIQIQIADVESSFASAISESRDIRVEGKLIDGVPHLTKLGAFEVVVSLIGYRHIILCRQVDQPARTIRIIRSILDDENKVYVRFTSVGRTPIAQQAVMVIVVDREPTEKALKRISKIPAVKEALSDWSPQASCFDVNVSLMFTGDYLP